jgi:hypothetical protein
MQRLRRAVERWGGGAGVAPACDAALIARVVADTRRGRLAAWMVPNGDIRRIYCVAETVPVPLAKLTGKNSDGPSVDQGAHRIAAHTPKLLRAPVPLKGSHSASTARLDIAEMSIERRVSEIIERAIPLMPAHVPSEFLSLLAAVSIGRVVALVAAWATSHAVDLGEILDLVLGAALVAGLVLMGWCVIEASRDRWKIVEIVRAARTEKDLDAGAALFAKAVTTLGVAVVNVLLMRGLRRPEATGKAQIGWFDKVAGGAEVAKPQRMRPREELAPLPAQPARPKSADFTTPSSGVPIKLAGNRTNTILGSYSSDTKRILAESGYPKAADFGSNKGGINILNIPDKKYFSPDQF